MKTKLQLSIHHAAQTVSLSIVDENFNGKIIFSEIRLNGGSFCSAEYFSKMADLLKEMVDNMNAYRQANGYDCLPIDGPSWIEDLSKQVLKPVSSREPDGLMASAYGALIQSNRKSGEQPKNPNRMEFNVLRKKMCPSGLSDNGLYYESVNTVSFPLDLLKIAVIVDMPDGVKGVEKPCSKIIVSGDTFLVVGKVKVA